jgi:hypothetical protein
MSYTIVEYNSLYYTFLQRTEDILDLCIEHEVAIIHSVFDCGFSTYMIKNKQSIIQKIFIIDGFIDDNKNVSTTFKIMNVYDQDLQCDFSINTYSSYIYLNKIEEYVVWFSKLNTQTKVLVE